MRGLTGHSLASLHGRWYTSGTGKGPDDGGANEQRGRVEQQTKGPQPPIVAAPATFPYGARASRGAAGTPAAETAPRSVGGEAVTDPWLDQEAGGRALSPVSRGYGAS